MVLFLKLMVISACLLLAILIFVAGHKTYKEGRADKVVWFIFIGAYGKFLVTKEQYESINVGDDAPGYLKK